jgi:hypothetical protein
MDPSCFLREPYLTTPIEKLKAVSRAQSLLAFRRRLIFTEAEPLRRAHAPFMTGVGRTRDGSVGPAARGGKK